MANEHSGRKQSIGLGKEGTSGTGVAATAWIPKISGSFKPMVETALDEGAYGIIDSVKEVTTVKNITEVQFSGIARDNYFGDILMALMGLEYPCIAFPIAGAITGTFVEGETITESTSLATGVLRRLDDGGSAKVLYISVTAGTFTGGQTLTGTTSSASATGGTIISPSAGRHHIFRRLNTNTPITYTLFGSDPVSDDQATFCALDNLEFECVVGNFAKFTATFRGKKLASTSAQTPVFTAQSAFLAKHATAKLAAAFTGLDAADAIAIERISFTFPKNLIDYTAFGSTDPTSFHNQDFGQVTGQITLLYNAITQRDYVINSTKQALRLTIANTEATAVSGSNYPTLQFDFPSVGFTGFDRTSENGGIVKQTLDFTVEYNVARAMSVEMMLLNTKVTAY